MQSIDSRMLPHHKPHYPWRQYLFDTLLALSGATGVTGIIYFFHLYPRIPNISIVYLLVVLPLAAARGRYAAMLTSLIAFLAFDFFLVPPLYLFTINRPEEWIALVIFLIDALLTGQLAAALRQRAEVATRREREARALYHLVHVANTAENVEMQLRAICQAIVETFASWGVRQCALLQPDAHGTLQVQVNTADISHDFTFTSGEQAVSHWSSRWARLFSPPPHFSPSSPTGKGEPTLSRHLLPLKPGHLEVGVLRLDVLGDPIALLKEEASATETRPQPSSLPDSFFQAFLNQVTALIERAQFQQENLRLAILKRTDALRAALLSSISHDLRTPLTTIKAAASSLLQEDVTWNAANQRGFLRSIEHEADRLNRLVANLLDMSRIEEGALVPDKDWYSLKMLMQDVLARLASSLQGREIHLNLPDADDLLMIELDYLQIDQVLTNLLENALRYTPPNSPLEITITRNEEQVTLSVTDHGPGIPTAHLEHVFDKFYRVLHGPVSTDIPTGSGLGLAVCKGLIEAHGGKIWAETRPAGGLSVSFTLPSKQQEERTIL